MNATLLKQYRLIAQSLLGDVIWYKEDKGYGRCPGIALHSGSNGKKDCAVYVTEGRPPTIYCVHTSCAASVAACNQHFRSACGKARWLDEHGRSGLVLKPRRRSAAELARVDRKNYLDDLGQRARAARANLLREYSWCAAEIAQDSPVIVGPAMNHWRLLLALFDPADIVWIGDRKDSGSPRHSDCFRPAAQWLAESRPPSGPLIAASTFMPGGFERTVARVVGSRILVVESDDLTRDEVGGIFRYLRVVEHVPLMAVIDTARVSLHAWFVRPSTAERLEELKVVLRALGCDINPMVPPCLSRLPSAWRGTRQQHLIYLDGRQRPSRDTPN